MLKRLLIIILFYTATEGTAQPIQRLPANGDNGYNGSAPRSFLIQWDTLAGASHYDYVISDNNLCFSGCSGDTRQHQPANNYTVESNLGLNKWYYWIVRAIMKDGDTTGYSPIYSFYTKPRPEDSRSYFTLGPNPVTEGSINIHTAWIIDPSIDYFNFKIFNMYGEHLSSYENRILTKSELYQTETFQVPLTGFQPGLYFIELSTNVSKVPERLKFLIIK